MLGVLKVIVSSLQTKLSIQNIQTTRVSFIILQLIFCLMSVAQVDDILQSQQ